MEIELVLVGDLGVGPVKLKAAVTIPDNIDDALERIKDALDEYAKELDPLGLPTGTVIYPWPDPIKNRIILISGIYAEEPDELKGFELAVRVAQHLPESQ